ncbi:unnamed protein product [Soboliphyme baturini]|uniref:G_PROTEIN_RECEP_F1_2 domain-containing protein n=1 Tax=Soboliphyme baturini TaxID=241478 RepID=A0A183IFD3_9BILA|nr:unnamed protein product [Soboliphyme baturini]
MYDRIDTTADLNFTLGVETNVTYVEYVFGKAVINLLELIGGLITIITNIFILAACAKIKRLTKEVVMLIGFSVGNVVMSIGYICAAGRWYYVYFSGHWLMKRSECIVQSVHITMFHIGEKFTLTLIVLISVDRLVAILSTKFYSKLCKKTIIKSVIATSLCSTVDYIVSFFIVYFAGRHDKAISANCDHEAVLGPLLFDVHIGVLLAASYSSSIIYLIALTLTTCHRHVSGEWRAARLKRQATITKRVGFLIITEFIFLAIPFTFFCFNHHSVLLTRLCDYCWIVSSYGLCIEVIICCFHNPDIKKALAKMAAAGSRLQTRVRCGKLEFVIVVMNNVVVFVCAVVLLYLHSASCAPRDTCGVSEGRKRVSLTGARTGDLSLPSPTLYRPTNLGLKQPVVNSLLTGIRSEHKDCKM